MRNGQPLKTALKTTLSPFVYKKESLELKTYFDLIAPLIAPLLVEFKPIHDARWGAYLFDAIWI